MTVWWEALPEGYYALPIEYDDEESTVLGYSTLRRGRTKLVLGAGWRNTTVIRPWADNCYRDEQDFVRGRCWNWRTIREFADEIAARADEYRAVYGRFHGRCGCCHRRLTDPQSKLRGIGPECWARRDQAAP